MPETLADIGEFGLIDRIEALLQKEGGRPRELVIGMGDDCAAFRPRPGMDLLVTCDTMVEGRHYLSRHISALDLGRRAMTINISDIGAMGGTPVYALVSLGLQSNTPAEDVDALYMGFLDALRPFQAVIMGGNITRSGGADFIDITLIGEIPSGTWVRRSTARPGDVILVTGYPGEAAAGLQILLSDPSAPGLRDHPLVKAYITPSHRAIEGAAIARSGLATAMIDISDGLLGDLGHICDQSRVGARLHQKGLPLRPPLREAARQLQRDPIEFVLGSSDDYELIITCPPEKVEEIVSVVAASGPLPITAIGEITPPSEGEGVISMTSPDGLVRKLGRSGWNHFYQ